MSFLRDELRSESDPLSRFLEFIPPYVPGRSAVQSDVSSEVQLARFLSLCHPGPSDLEAAARSVLVLFPMKSEEKLGESSAPVRLKSGSGTQNQAGSGFLVRISEMKSRTETVSFIQGEINHLTALLTDPRYSPSK